MKLARSNTKTPRYDAFVDAGPAMSKTVSQYDWKKMVEVLGLLRDAEFDLSALQADAQRKDEALRRAKGLTNLAWNEARIETLQDLGKVTDNWKDESGVTAQEYRERGAEIISHIDAALSVGQQG